MVAKCTNRSELELSVPKQEDGFFGMEALASRMKSRSVQEPSEDVRDFLLHDSRSIIFDDDEELVFFYLIHFDQDVREDFSVFVAVELLLASLFDDVYK